MPTRWLFLRTSLRVYFVCCLAPVVATVSSCCWSVRLPFVIPPLSLLPLVFLTFCGAEHSTDTSSPCCASTPKRSARMSQLFFNSMDASWRGSNTMPLIGWFGEPQSGSLSGR
uniref:Putative secreted peptide n=1 Tax=Anopheles braziliensis TaxID=58242 RepID=A0A2M3ZS55_9DIPT